MPHLRVVATIVVLSLATFGSAACDDQPGSSVPTASQTPEPVETPAPGDHDLSLEWNGQHRTFKVHAPPAYDVETPLPLVVTMHYYPGDADGIATTSDMSAKADEEGFLVLYPEGLGGGMNALVCCGSQDDVGLIKTLVERMVTRWNADPKRVYATGISNGGDMSFKLAVEASGVFAAIAPVSGGFIGAETTSQGYRPKAPVSVISFIGGGDRYFSQFSRGLETWRKRMSCTPAKTTEPALPNGIKHTTFTCADGSVMSVYELPQMGHSWPGAKDGSLSDPDAGLNATDLIWDFFKSRGTTS